MANHTRVDASPGDHPMRGQVRSELEALADRLEGQSRATVELQTTGDRVVLSDEATEALRTLLNRALNPSQERAELSRRITTQQAATILGVSRPFVITLLERGEIPFERLGSSRHRRIELAEVLAYQMRMRQLQRDALAGMTKEAASAGLYDQIP